MCCCLLQDDLEEALLFEFEGEEAALTPKTTTITVSSLLSATGSAGSLPAAGSLPSVLSGVRSITKDAGGTHVLTENFTLHIEEVGPLDSRICSAAGSAGACRLSGAAQCSAASGGGEPNMTCRCSAACCCMNCAFQ